MGSFEYDSFSAEDIARLLVRNPDDLMDLPTYERICDEFCRGRAFENLSRDEKDAVFSLEVGVNDLFYLGFNKAQIQTMLEAYYEAHAQVSARQAPPELAERTLKHRAYLTAYTAAAFPYGPPIVIHEPYNLMAREKYSLTQTRSFLNNLTKTTACRLMDRWQENRTLFIPSESPQMSEPEFGDSEFSLSP